MKFIKKNKAVLLLYLVIVIGTLLISWNNKQYKKSISAGIEITDIQK